MKDDHITLFGVAITIFLFVAYLYFICSCTISFQNISTHGTATDVVDDNMTNDVQANPNVSLLPHKPLPKSAAIK